MGLILLHSSSVANISLNLMFTILLQKLYCISHLFVCMCGYGNLSDNFQQSSFLLPLCMFWRSNSGNQMWEQQSPFACWAILPVSCQISNVLLGTYLAIYNCIILLAFILYMNVISHAILLLVYSVKIFKLIFMDLNQLVHTYKNSVYTQLY